MVVASIGGNLTVSSPENRSEETASYGIVMRVGEASMPLSFTNSFASPSVLQCSTYSIILIVSPANMASQSHPKEMVRRCKVNKQIGHLRS